MSAFAVSTMRRTERYPAFWTEITTSASGGKPGSVKMPLAFVVTHGMDAFP